MILICVGDIINVSLSFRTCMRVCERECACWVSVCVCRDAGWGLGGGGGGGGCEINLNIMKALSLIKENLSAAEHLLQTEIDLTYVKI